jgi:predicted RNA-binding Zn-ribbon protein involved in translation (DUF1610 family)
MLDYLSELQVSPVGAEILLSLACIAVVVFVVVVMVKRGIEMTCPNCGKRVGRGKLDCPHCGFDFRTIGADST